MEAVCEVQENRGSVVWMCQYIFIMTRSILVSLPHQNEVLHIFWKRYLQKSKQAYCKNPVHTSRRKTTVSHMSDKWDQKTYLVRDRNEDEVQPYLNYDFQRSSIEEVSFIVQKERVSDVGIEINFDFLFDQLKHKENCG